MEERTIVVFRKWPNGQIIALFPEVKHTGPYCSSYEPVGQHGGADYTGVVGRTSPATPREYAELKSELENHCKYVLEVKQRWQRNSRKA